MEYFQGLNARVTLGGVSTILDPIELDVMHSWPDRVYDAVYSANTAHIMSMPAVRCMFDVARRLLSDDGVFCLYGPFNEDGEFSSDSNRDFDRSLRSQDPVMGIRNLEDLDGLADGSMMHRERLYAMPANNLLAVWRKQGMQKENDDS
jgi:hypothetical protein